MKAEALESARDVRRAVENFMVTFVQILLLLVNRWECTVLN